uniref:Jacalin-type lectin domain-containing protein n=1 Tax=Oryza glumipatula TaxID=40148 RepID=A0A0D9Y891_9ORYZ
MAAIHAEEEEEGKLSLRRCGAAGVTLLSLLSPVRASQLPAAPSLALPLPPRIACSPLALHEHDEIIKIGMWGASNGTSHDIVEAPPKDLISIQIKSIDTIDRLTFTYKDTKGNQQKVSWGGNLGYDQPVPYTVNSLTFVTSEGRRYGTWGKRGKDDTDFKVPVEKGRIVGFHARGDGFISAIGLYIRP